MGPSSSGKSTIAKELNIRLKGKIFTGKDYLRLAKNKENAWKIFKDKLSTGEENIIYVCTEIEDVRKLRDLSPIHFIKIIADLDDLKKRFAERMRGHLPPPVEKMLENQYKIWKQEKAEFTINSSAGILPQENAKQIIKKLHLEED